MALLLDVLRRESGSTVPAVPTTHAAAARLDLGAVVVTHRRPDLALSCVASIADACASDAMCVVVNDASCESHPAVAELRALGVQVLVSERPRGYGANLNAGVACIPEGVPMILLLNDDITFEAGAAQALVNALTGDTRVALAGPRVTRPDGREEPSACRFPTIRSVLAEHALLPHPLMRLARAGAGSVRVPRGVRDVDWILGAAMLVRRSAFLSVGGMDEDFFMYQEEVDLAWRLRTAGWTVVSCGDACVMHVGASSTGRRMKTEGLASRRLLLVRHWPRWRRLTLGVLGYALTVHNRCALAVVKRVRPRVHLEWLATHQTRESRRFFGPGTSAGA
jgi:N-acetylglucosaminyl-diphospho-decaprenol L-rhamnosyltransferase